MPTPAEFEEIMKNDPDAAIKCITTPLLDRVDKIVADPITGLTEILSSAMYFINSNGLETAFTNLVAAVDTVLACLEDFQLEHKYFRYRYLRDDKERFFKDDRGRRKAQYISHLQFER
jgi:hypothetical protein